MNYNVLAYSIYLSLTLFIIIFVGHFFYRNGRIFILTLLNGDAPATDYLNKLLLIAYYLFNIGYAFVKLRFWDTVNTLAMLVSSIANNISLLIFILATTHYMNMILIWSVSRSKKSFLTTKTFQS